MRSLVALLIAGVGVVGGLYVGVYVMFYKGIIQIIQSVTPEVVAQGIGMGVVKVMFASLVGWMIAWTGFILAKIVNG